MKRTPAQNNSLHLYLERLAESLNDAGYDLKAILTAKQVSVPCTKENLKEIIWRPVQEAMYSIHSTTKLDKMQVDDVYRVVDRHISEHFGVHVEFPSQEGLDAKEN